MKIGDVLYFSPRFPFANLNLDDTSALITAFLDRVEGFYLRPAARSLQLGDAFAGGLVCCAAVEFMAEVGEEIKPVEWLQAHIPEFAKNAELAQDFWIRFRHGLAHEGYVKKQGQFSFDIPELLTVVGPVLVINPLRLLDAVEKAVGEYGSSFTDTKAITLRERLHRYFDAEIRSSRA